MGACDSQFASRIQAYHDGRLDKALSAEVDAHVKSCAACAAELRELRSLSDMFTAIPPARLSQIGLARVHKAIDAMADDERGILTLARWLSAAAAMVLLSATLALARLTGSGQNTQVATPTSTLVPQAWERVAMSGWNDGTTSSQQSTVVDAEWIVADLSRRSIP